MASESVASFALPAVCLRDTICHAPCFCCAVCCIPNDGAVRCLCFSMCLCMDRYHSQTCPFSHWSHAEWWWWRKKKHPKFSVYCFFFSWIISQYLDIYFCLFIGWFLTWIQLRMAKTASCSINQDSPTARYCPHALFGHLVVCDDDCVCLLLPMASSLILEVLTVPMLFIHPLPLSTIFSLSRCRSLSPYSLCFILLSASLLPSVLHASSQFSFVRAASRVPGKFPFRANSHEITELVV